MVRARARAAVLAVVLASAWASASAEERKVPLPEVRPSRSEAPAKPAAGAARVTGFRSARFGMSEAELRAAIASDFPGRAEAVTVDVNPVERTTILSLAVPDLLPDAGTAEIGYVLGYKSRALIQVQVVWGRPADPRATPGSLIAAARLLENHLGQQGFAPENVVSEAGLANGDFLVFRGVDGDGRMTTLVLSGESVVVDGKPRLNPSVLRLGYVANPADPDVFRLEHGAF